MERWKAALSKWDKWNSSVERTRVRMQRKFGNIDERIAGAKIEFKEIAENPSSQGIRIIINDQMAMKWKIETELEKDAHDFVYGEMGLQANSEFHDVFADYWIQSVFPAFRPEIGLKHQVEDTGKTRFIEVKGEPKSRKDRRIWNSVGWYHDEADHREVARFLERIEWPFSREQAQRHAGGRPKAEVDTLLCYIFRRKLKMPEGKVGQMFGWKTYMDSYGMKCREVRKRVTQGKKLVEKYNLEIITP